MKNVFGLMMFVVIPAFAGCFDVVHYIEPRKDKTVFIDYRITSVMGKEKNKDINFDKDSIVKDFKIESLKVKPVIKDCSTEYEAGVDISFAIPQSMMKFPSEDMKSPLIPYLDKSGQYVLIFRNDKNDKKETESDRMAQALLMSARYRIVIGNAKPTHVVIINNSNDGIKKFTPLIYNLGSQYNIDIPMGLVFGTESAVIISFGNVISDAEMMSFFSAINKKHDEKLALEKKEQERLDKIEKDRIEKEEKIQLDKGKAERNSIEKIPGQDSTPEAVEELKTDE